MRLSLQRRNWVRISCGVRELRDRGNEVKTDNKQEHCPHPFINPAQAQEGVIELKSNLVWVCILSKRINWELRLGEQISTQNPLFLLLATRTLIFLSIPLLLT